MRERHLLPAFILASAAGKKSEKPVQNPPDLVEQAKVERAPAVKASKNTLKEMLELTLRGSLTKGKDIIEQTIDDIAEGVATDPAGKVDAALAERYAKEYKTLLDTDVAFREEIEKIAHKRFTELLENSKRATQHLNNLHGLADVKQWAQEAMADAEEQGVPAAWMKGQAESFTKNLETTFLQADHLWKKLGGLLDKKNMRDLKNVLESDAPLTDASQLIQMIQILKEATNAPTFELLGHAVSVSLKERLLSVPPRRTSLQRKMDWEQRQVNRTRNEYRRAPKEQHTEAFKRKYERDQQQRTRQLEQTKKELASIQRVFERPDKIFQNMEQALATLGVEKQIVEAMREEFNHVITAEPRVTDLRTLAKQRRKYFAEKDKRNRREI